MLAEAKLTQSWKDVVRLYVKFRLCNVLTTLTLRCDIAATTSLLNVVITLSTDVGETVFSNKLTTSMQPVVWRCDKVVTTSLCSLGCGQMKGHQPQSHMTLWSHDHVRSCNKWKSPYCIKIMTNKHYRMVVYDKGPLTTSDPSIIWSSVVTWQSKTLYFHFHQASGHDIL